MLETSWMGPHYLLCLIEHLGHNLIFSQKFKVPKWIYLLQYFQIYHSLPSIFILRWCDLLLLQAMQWQSPKYYLKHSILSGHNKFPPILTKPWLFKSITTSFTHIIISSTATHKHSIIQLKNMGIKFQINIRKHLFKVNRTHLLLNLQRR